jgi:hypothetical protein
MIIILFLIILLLLLYTTYCVYALRYFQQRVEYYFLIYLFYLLNRG